MSQDSLIKTENLNVYYGSFHALKNINSRIPSKKITAVMGPSGCGKTTYLKCLNRMVELVGGAKITGKVIINGKNIYDPDVDVTALRKKVGMVFQKPNPLPMSIFDNVAYGPRIHGEKNREKLKLIVETNL